MHLLRLGVRARAAATPLQRVHLPRLRVAAALSSPSVRPKDIVEELFGEIEDEHDTTDLIEEQLEDGSFKFSARLEVDYINETYKLELPKSDEYETVGGLIVNEKGEIPEKDSEIQIENFLFKIIEVSNTKIDLLTVKLIEKD